MNALDRALRAADEANAPDFIGRSKPFHVPGHTPAHGRLHPARKSGSVSRRWNWRTHAHYGRGWWNMTHAQVSKELRMMSHRRKL